MTQQHLTLYVLNLFLEKMKMYLHFMSFLDINSSPPSVAYMHHWSGSALVQIMACRLFGVKPLSKPMQVIVNCTLRKKLQWNFNRNTKLFIRENASENMAAILSRGRWVKVAQVIYPFSLKRENKNTFRPGNTQPWYWLRGSKGFSYPHDLPTLTGYECKYSAVPL